MTTKWSGTRVVADGTIAGANVAAVTVRESYTVNATRTILSVDVSVTSTDGAPKVSQLKFVPITDLGPCEKWPTPCKR